MEKDGTLTVEASLFTFTPKDIVIGNEILFDSDPEDDDASHIHKGLIKVYTPKNKTIAVKCNETSTVSTYFVDEIKIKSISPSPNARRTQSTLESCISFDLAVFETQHDYRCIRTENSNHIIKHCKPLQRLVAGLKYYSLLNISNDKVHQDIFANFVDHIYKDLIDDYNHLDDIHNDQLEQIHQVLIQSKTYAFTKCQINKCVFTARHHNTENEPKKPTKCKVDPSLTFYKDTMDSLHFYLFHLFDCGLMTLKGIDYDDMDALTRDYDNDTFNDEELIDCELSLIQQNMTRARKNTSQFERYNNNAQNNKFNIVVDMSATFTDGLNHYLQQDVGINVIDHYNLKTLIESHEYDTDAITLDIDFKPQGNIRKCMQNDESSSAIEQFIDHIQLQSTSFNIGFVFYYWPYFYGRKEIESSDEENVNDHGGYAISELCIEKKYNTFKDEIRNYKHINMTDYDEMIVTKANKYLTTHTVKTLIVDVLLGNAVHYGLDTNSKFAFPNIVSLILYTDFNDHSTDFSSSFRKKTPFESVESIKTRNKEYYWMSKILRETVEIFGQNRDGIWDGKNLPKHDPKNRINKLLGPFFTGLSSVMAVPEFNIRLCSPTSCSKRIEVAIKFGGDEGMVIQLNNPIGGYELGKGFNCSWISRYKEEDERLFFGGSWRTKIESIRILKTKQNYGYFFHCLTYFDGMVNGKVMDKETIGKRDRKIIQKLINWKLKIRKSASDDNKFDEYVYDTFDCFARHKAQILLSLESLEVHGDEKLRNMIMYPIDPYYRSYLDLHQKDENTNLFRAVLFKLFPNLKRIIIYSAPNSYTLSLFALLPLIESSETLRQVKIKAAQDDGSFQTSWLNDLWISKSKLLKELYKSKGYEISFKSITDEDEDVLWIRKITPR